MFSVEVFFLNPSQILKTFETIFVACRAFLFPIRLFLYARHLTEVLLYGSVRSSVRSVVHNHCGQDIARTIWPRMLKLRRSLSIFKVKGQISKSLGLYKEFWHLDPCGQDIARTIQPTLLKLSMYTILNMERGRSLLIFKVKGHISRSLDGYLGNFIWFKSNC